MDPQNQPPTSTPPQDTSPQTPTTAPASPQKKGYGKRPLWQWILLYIVVAGVVYALIWFLFLRSSGGSGY